VKPRRSPAAQLMSGGGHAADLRPGTFVITPVCSVGAAWLYLGPQPGEAEVFEVPLRYLMNRPITVGEFEWDGVVRQWLSMPYHCLCLTDSSGTQGDSFGAPRQACCGICTGFKRLTGLVSAVALVKRCLLEVEWSGCDGSPL
jgi:hypothetical protein